MLLSQDPVLLPFLEERRRYAPPVALVAAYLAGTATWQLASDISELPGSMLGAETLLFGAKQAACLAATLPCQIYLVVWLWSKAQVSAGPGWVVMINDW